MGHASQYEDITERFFESEPTHLIYGVTEPHDPVEEYLSDCEIAQKLKAFRVRIQTIVLSSKVPEENEREVFRLRNFNEKWQKELEEIWKQMNAENTVRSKEKIRYREGAIEDSLRQIVSLTLSPSQKTAAAAFERRLMLGTPRRNHCLSCKKNIAETVENFCVYCGGIKCSCSVCFFSLQPSNVSSQL